MGTRVYIMKTSGSFAVLIFAAFLALGAHAGSITTDCGEGSRCHDSFKKYTEPRMMAQLNKFPGNCNAWTTTSVQSMTAPSLYEIFISKAWHFEQTTVHNGCGMRARCEGAGKIERPNVKYFSFHCTQIN